jgi:hypothetical protein
MLTPRPTSIKDLIDVGPRREVAVRADGWIAADAAVLKNAN